MLHRCSVAWKWSFCGSAEVLLKPRLPRLFLHSQDLDFQIQMQFYLNLKKGHWATEQQSSSSSLYLDNIPLECIDIRNATVVWCLLMHPSSWIDFSQQSSQGYCHPDANFTTHFYCSQLSINMLQYSTLGTAVTLCGLPSLGRVSVIARATVNSAVFSVI